MNIRLAVKMLRDAANRLEVLAENEYASATELLAQQALNSATKINPSLVSAAIEALKTRSEESDEA